MFFHLLAICVSLYRMRRSSYAWRQFNFPPFVRRIAACSSRKERHAAKYSITKSVRWLGKISSKCVYFIDNPFKVVVFVRIYCHLSSHFFLLAILGCVGYNFSKGKRNDTIDKYKIIRRQKHPDTLG